MNHIMIDIETTGVLPGCKVLTIGAVVFNKKGFGEEFYTRLSYEKLESAGFTDTDSTMDWWNKQTPEVADEAFTGETNPKEGLKSFDDFIKRHNPNTIWCKGASFDFPILAYILNHYNLPPLPYRALRCMRGVSDLANVEPIIFRGNAHNALDDAKNQAINIGKCISALGAWERI